MIAAEGLTKKFGDNVAVDDVSFEVPPGQVTGFLGHNGAGKTTTLRMLLGHVIPDAGRATILGKPFASLREPLQQVGVLFDSGVHPGRTARDHLRVCAAVGELPTHRIDFLLGLVGLEDAADRRAGGFSTGMRQRLGIAAALLADPDVLIFDEPANGLDPEGIRWLRGLLRELAGAGRTIMVSSHHLAEIAQTVDQVLVMDRGRLVAQSSLRELIREAGAEVVVRSPGAEVLAEELRAVGIATTSVSTDEVRVRDVPASIVSELAVSTGLPIWEVSAREPDLEQAFFALTERGREETESDDDDDESQDDAEKAARAKANGRPVMGSRPGEGSDAETEQAAAEAEERQDKRLGTHPQTTGSWVIAVTAAGPRVGRTTLACLLGDVLAAHTRARTLVVGLSCDRGLLRLAAPTDQRSSLALGDLLSDLPDLDESARISPYVSTMHSGAETLGGVTNSGHLASIAAKDLVDLLAFARRFYEAVVLDVGELEHDALEAVLRRVDQVVLVSTQDAVERGGDDGDDVLELLGEVRRDPAILVMNQVEPAQARARGAAPDGGPTLVPADRGLIRALDAGDYKLSQVSPPTRVALKHLALTVAERLR